MFTYEFREVNVLERKIVMVWAYQEALSAELTGANSICLLFTGSFAVILECPPHCYFQLSKI